SAVSSTASTPTGTLIQKIDRQPTESTSTPPRIGPSDMLRPTTAPHMPIACPRSRGSVNLLVMIDIPTGLSMDPPTACSIRNATSVRVDGAMLQQRSHAEQHETELEDALAPDPVGRRPGQHQQAGDHDGVGVDRPL